MAKSTDIIIAVDKGTVRGINVKGPLPVNVTVVDFDNGLEDLVTTYTMEPDAVEYERAMEVVQKASELKTTLEEEAWASLDVSKIMADVVKDFEAGKAKEEEDVKRREVLEEAREKGQSAYNYWAKKPDGSDVSATRIASSVGALVAGLKKEGLVVLNIEEVSDK